MKSPSRWLLACGCLTLGVAVGAFFAGSISQGQPPARPVSVIPREMTSYRDVVRRVLPAVVSIDAKAKPRKQSTPPRKPADGIPKPYQPFFEEPEPKTAPDDGDLGFGSGFVIDPAGVILTNYHVVEGADELEIQTTDGRKFVSRDFRADKRTDLAIVRIQPKQPLPALEFGDSDAMEIGDRVLALGAPFGLRGSVTAGIVSAKGRSIRLNNYEDFIQTDAAVNPGNSGGPLVNLEGKVIGITSAIKSRSGGFQGVALAIASNLARTTLNQLLKDGVVHRGFIGAQVDDIDPDTLTKLGLRKGGVVTTTVLASSPAAKGGLKVGDVITAIDGKPIRDGRDMQHVVAELPLNQPVGFIVLRDGKLLNLAITIIDQPEVKDPPRRSPGRDR